jgi:hypothetical protein
LVVTTNVLASKSLLATDPVSVTVGVFTEVVVTDVFGAARAVPVPMTIKATTIINAKDIFNILFIYSSFNQAKLL